LTRRQRRAVDEVIRAMLEPTKSVSEPTPLTARRRRPAQRQAARHGKAEPPSEN
jgi:hypothetical protein